MFPHGKRDQANRKREKIREKIKRKNLRENVLALAEIEKYLVNSTSYLGAIYVSSFKKLIVKARKFSFLVYCTNHWFVIYSDNNTIEIFDSLGFLKTKSCITKNVLNFIRNVTGSKNLKASHSVQSPNSTLCGVFALYYIIQRDSGKTFEQIMGTFSTVKTDNDRLMLRFYNKISQ